jgi:hypothetical protein
VDNNKAWKNIMSKYQPKRVQIITKWSRIILYFSILLHWIIIVCSSYFRL